MKCVIALAFLAIVAVSAAAPLTTSQYEFLFTRYVEQYNKQYEVEQFFAKYNTFKSNLDYILEHNSKNDVSFTLAMNEFGDMTSEEFAEKMLGFKNVEAPFARSLNTVDTVDASIGADDAFDWRSQGGVTPVKNQGQCGSCWAFSATGSIEGAWKVKTGNLVSASEQQLVDCSGSAGNYGCRGGLMDRAFEWIIKNGGICTEAAYPYTAKDGTCKTCTPAIKLTGYKNVASRNEAALQTAVRTVPVSVAIAASDSAFQFYKSGVMDGTCSTRLNHGVLAVGYGTDNGKKYWSVKNSWGTSWGEQGYIRMIRDRNQCGIAQQPVYATA